jgi:hypothetical protein
VGFLSGHASNLEHFQHVLNVVVDLQGAAPESLVIAAAVDDDAEGVDAAVLLVDIDLYVVSVWHNRLQLDFTHPVALDGVDEHVHGRDELGADLLDAALAEDLAVDAAAVLLDKVGTHGVLAERSGGAVAGESGAIRDGALEVSETRVKPVEDVVFGALDVTSRGSLAGGGTARATIDVGAVADGLDGVSKDCASCLVSLSTYEVSGHRDGSAQAEDAEDGDEEQHDCRELGGESHGGSADVGDGG